MPEDFNIKLCMYLLSKLGDFSNAPLEELEVGGALVYKAQSIPPKHASLAPALGSGGLEG